MPKKKHKTWGNYNQQTVRRESPSQLVIREGGNQISVHSKEVDSLVIALIKMKSTK